MDEENHNCLTDPGDFSSTGDLSDYQVEGWGSDGQSDPELADLFPPVAVFVPVSSPALVTSPTPIASPSLVASPFLAASPVPVASPIVVASPAPVSSPIPIPPPAIADSPALYHAQDTTNSRIPGSFQSNSSLSRYRPPRRQ